eukprot:212055_1
MGNEPSINKLNRSHLKVPKNESVSSTLDDSEIDTISVLSEIDNTPSIFSERSNITNGVINEYVSQRLVAIVATFWLLNIEQMSMESKLEIGCSIFYDMIAANTKVKKKITVIRNK